MKDLIKILASALILMLGVVSTAGATLLDFSDSGNLGLNLGGNMLWNGIGGGHLYVEQYNDDDYVIFLDSSTYVSQFEMNYMPWEGYGSGDGSLVTIEAFSAANVSLWSETVDLSAYMDWADWRTVVVNTPNVASMAFYATNNPQGGGWPSIDNMVINEARVPEPTTLALLALGLVGVGARQRRFRS